MTMIAIEMIPDLFLVGQLEGDSERRFFVYPYTQPPDPGDLSRARRLSEADAQEYAARLNSAVRVFVDLLLSRALGAVANEVVQWGAIPGSPASQEAQEHLMLLGKLLLAHPTARAACAFFQARQIQQYHAGAADAQLEAWIQNMQGGTPSPN